MQKDYGKLSLMNCVYWRESLGRVTFIPSIVMLAMLAVFLWGLMSLSRNAHQVEEILKELNCFPVFLDEEVLRSHYHGFCKKILWPVLHNSVNMLEWWDELIDRFAEDNIFANRPLMDRYFNSYSIVNDTIARCVEQL